MSKQMTACVGSPALGYVSCAPSLPESDERGVVLVVSDVRDGTCKAAVLTPAAAIELGLALVASGQFQGQMPGVVE